MEQDKKSGIITKVIIGAAIGGTAFLVYKKWDKIKELFTGKGGGTGGGDTGTEYTGGGSTDSGVSAYEKKVMELQGLIGAAVDGQAGKQTNGWLEYYWEEKAVAFDPEVAFKLGYPQLKKLGKGVVSADNVDYYIQTLKDKKSPRQLFWARGGVNAPATQSSAAAEKEKATWEAWWKKYYSNTRAGHVRPKIDPFWYSPTWVWNGTDYVRSPDKLETFVWTPVLNYNLLTEVRKVGYTKKGFLVGEILDRKGKYLILDSNQWEQVS